MKPEVFGKQGPELTENETVIFDINIIPTNMRHTQIADLKMLYSAWNPT